MRRIDQLTALALTLVGAAIACKAPEGHSDANNGGNSADVPQTGTGGTVGASSSSTIPTALDAAAPDAMKSQDAVVASACGSGAVPAGQSPDDVTFLDGKGLGVLHGWTWPSWGKDDTVTTPQCLPGTYASATHDHPCTESITWSSGKALCLAGTVAAVPSSSASESWGVAIGIDVDKCGGLLGKDYTSIAVSATGIPPQAIQNGLWHIGLNVKQPSGQVVLYYAPDDGTGAPIPFTRFNTQWWDPKGGDYLRPEQVASVVGVVAFVHSSPNFSTAVPDLCLTKIAFGRDRGATVDAATLSPTVDAQPVVDAASERSATLWDSSAASGLVGPSLSDFIFSTWTSSSEATSTMTIGTGQLSVEWHGRSASDGEGGLAASFSKATDLTPYDQIWFDATIPEGQVTTVGIWSKDSNFCKWKVVGAGSARYFVDMTSPAVYCGKTQCGFKRDSITNIYFDTGWWGTQYVTDMTLTSLGLAVAKGSVSAMSNAKGANYGLNGWCWWLWTVNDAASTTCTASSAWVTTPNASQCHFDVADTCTQAMAGVMIYLPQETFKDLSAYKYLVIDAAVGGFSKFGVSLMSSTGAHCDWNVVQNASEFVFNLGSYDYCQEGGGVDFDITGVQAIRITSDYEGTGAPDIDVSAISLAGAK